MEWRIPAAVLARTHVRECACLIIHPFIMTSTYLLSLLPGTIGQTYRL